MAKKRVRVLNDFQISEISGCSKPVQKGATARLIKANPTKEDDVTKDDIARAVEEYLAPIQDDIDMDRAVASIEKAVDDMPDDHRSYLGAIAESDALTDDEKNQLAGAFVSADDDERDALVDDLAESVGDSDDDYGDDDYSDEEIAAIAEQDALEDLQAAADGEDAAEAAEIGKSWRDEMVEARLSKAEDRAAQAEEEVELMKAAESVEAAFPNLPGSPYQKALVMKALDEDITDPNVREYLTAMLSGADQAYGMANVPAGALDVLEKADENSPQSGLQSAIDELVNEQQGAK